MVRIFSSYSQKLLILTLVVSLVPVSMVAAYHYYDKMDSNKEEMTKDITLLSLVGKDNIELWIEDKKDTVSKISKNSLVISNTNALLNGGHNFDVRKHVVQYDDVMNKQREIFYNERDKVLEHEDLSDQIKEESKQAISELHKLGVKVAMLTGDIKAAAMPVAKELGIDTVFAEVLPEDKYKHIKEER